MLQQSQKDLLALIQQHQICKEEMQEDVRSLVVTKLTNLFNEFKIKIPYNVKAGSFRPCDSYIVCGKDYKWEIQCWLDGIVQVTNYDEDLGGTFDPKPGIELTDVVMNPLLIIDELTSHINLYRHEKKHNRNNW
jgi:hypothetical protein